LRAKLLQLLQNGVRCGGRVERGLALVLGNHELLDLLHTGSSRQALLLACGADKELTLGDAWLEVFQQALPRNRHRWAGTLIARPYRDEFS
jgi:hypothetical protein